jgi:hypothetical protein
MYLRHYWHVSTTLLPWLQHYCHVSTTLLPWLQHYCQVSTTLLPWLQHYCHDYNTTDMYLQHYCHDYNTTAYYNTTAITLHLDMSSPPLCHYTPHSPQDCRHLTRLTSQFSCSYKYVQYLSPLHKCTRTIWHSQRPLQHTLCTLCPRSVFRHLATHNDCDPISTLKNTARSASDWPQPASWYRGCFWCHFVGRNVAFFAIRVPCVWNFIPHVSSCSLFRHSPPHVSCTHCLTSSLSVHNWHLCNKHLLHAVINIVFVSPSVSHSHITLMEVWSKPPHNTCISPNLFFNLCLSRVNFRRFGIIFFFFSL